MKTFLNTSISALTAVIIALGISGCVAATCPTTDPYCHEDEHLSQGEMK